MQHYASVQKSRLVQDMIVLSISIIMEKVSIIYKKTKLQYLLILFFKMEMSKMRLPPEDKILNLY